MSMFIYFGVFLLFMVALSIFVVVYTGIDASLLIAESVHLTPYLLIPVFLTAIVVLFNRYKLAQEVSYYRKWQDVFRGLLSLEDDGPLIKSLRLKVIMALDDKNTLELLKIESDFFNEIVTLNKCLGMGDAISSETRSELLYSAKENIRLKLIQSQKEIESKFKVDFEVLNREREVLKSDNEVIPNTYVGRTSSAINNINTLGLLSTSEQSLAFETNQPEYNRKESSSSIDSYDYSHTDSSSSSSSSE